MHFWLRRSSSAPFFTPQPPGYGAANSVKTILAGANLDETFSFRFRRSKSDRLLILLKYQAHPRLRRGVAAQTFKELAAALGVLPDTAIMPVVIPPRLGRHPDLMQWLLQVDDDLAAIGKAQGDHPARPLIVDVRI